MTAKTWAVVPSNGRHYLEGSLRSLRSQVEGIIVVANGDFQPVGLGSGVRVVHDPGTDRNISRWWNLGIAEVAHMAGEDPWNALIVNDDVICPPRLAATLAAKLDQYGACLAYPNQWDDLEIVWRRAEPVNLHHRITGYAFMLSGGSGLRLREDLVWWFGDDDLDWRARETGGAVLVPGCAVEHLAPNGSLLDHPELQHQTGLDRQTFVNRWGKAPW